MNVFFLLFLLYLQVNQALFAKEYDCLSNPVYPLYFQQVQMAKTSSLQDEYLLRAQRLSKDEILKILGLKKDAIDIEHYKKELYEHCSSLIYSPPDSQSLIPKNHCEMKLSSQTLDVDSEYEKLHCDFNKTLRRSPMDIQDYVQAFQQSIANYESKSKTKVYMSKEHTWNPDTHKERIKEYPMSRFYSKLLLSLAMGVTSRYMITDKDEELTHYLESSPSSSITPQLLLEKSLELQEGDLYLALLSIENVLSRHWTSPQRNQLRQNKSLASIIYHCPGDKKEDKFGSWYHLFGLMLYGCVEGGTKASMIGRIENAGSRVLDMGSIDGTTKKLLHLFFGSDPQEEKLGRRAGRIGHKVCLPYKK